MMITLQSPVGFIPSHAFFAKPWGCLHRRDTEGHFLYLASLKPYKDILYTIRFLSTRRVRIWCQISIISFRFRSIAGKLSNFHIAGFAAFRLVEKPQKLLHTNQLYSWIANVAYLLALHVSTVALRF